MRLIKGKREAWWVPFSKAEPRQIRRGVGGSSFAFVEFEGTPEERAMATRLGRPDPLQRSWVNMANLEDRGGT